MSYMILLKKYYTMDGGLYRVTEVHLELGHIGADTTLVINIQQFVADVVVFLCIFYQPKLLFFYNFMIEYFKQQKIM